MNLVKKITAGRVLSVLDVGPSRAIAVLAEKNEDGTFRVLGGGESAVQGIEAGRITNAGDALECLLEAVRQAEKTSGLDVDTLYYNLNDADIESVRPKGAKQLAGEGQIQASDIEDAKKNAERLIVRFDNTIVYSRETGFVIDGKDRVLDPRGVFGTKLEVDLYVLLARADERDKWKTVFRRGHFDKTVPVLAAWSVAYGVIPQAERSSKKVVWNWAKDLTTGFVFERNRILAYQGFVTPAQSESVEKIAESVKKWSSRYEGIGEVLLTGDLAEQNTAVEAVSRAVSPLGVQAASPSGIPTLTSPRHAALAGLLHVADELEEDRPLISGHASRLSGLREKATAFLNDYF